MCPLILLWMKIDVLSQDIWSQFLKKWVYPGIALPAIRCHIVAEVEKINQETNDSHVTWVYTTAKKTEVPQKLYGYN